MTKHSFLWDDNSVGGNFCFLVLARPGWVTGVTE